MRSCNAETQSRYRSRGLVPNGRAFPALTITLLFPTCSFPSFPQLALRAWIRTPWIPARTREINHPAFKQIKQMKTTFSWIRSTTQAAQQTGPRGPRAQVRGVTQLKVSQQRTRPLQISPLLSFLNVERRMPQVERSAKAYLTSLLIKTSHQPAAPRAARPRTDNLVLAKDLKQPNPIELHQQRYWHIGTQLPLSVQSTWFMLTAIGLVATSGQCTPWPSAVLCTKLSSHMQVSPAKVAIGYASLSPRTLQLTTSWTLLSPEKATSMLTSLPINTPAKVSSDMWILQSLRRNSSCSHLAQTELSSQRPNVSIDATRKGTWSPQVPGESLSSVRSCHPGWSSTVHRSRSSSTSRRPSNVKNVWSMATKPKTAAANLPVISAEQLTTQHRTARPICSAPAARGRTTELRKNSSASRLFTERLLCRNVTRLAESENK